MVQTRGKHIVIAGAMGVGKTTVGRLLAARIDRLFYDSDEALEASRGEKGVDIAVREGVGRLHEIELAIFLESCRSDVPAVIAAASSVVDNIEARREMVENVTVWLTASDEALRERQAGGDHRRDVDPDEATRLKRRRDPWLESVSAITIDTSDRSPEEVVAELVDRLASAITGL